MKFWIFLSLALLTSPVMAQQSPTKPFAVVIRPNRVNQATVLALGHDLDQHLSRSSQTNIVRPVRQILAEDYGFKCDGITDNAVTVTALNKITSGQIFFRPSAAECLTSVPLSPQNGVNLVARPGTTTIAPTPGNMANPMLLRVERVGGLAYGLSFDGGGRDFANGAAVILGYRARGYVWDHIHVENTHGIALMCSDCSNSGVKSSAFFNVGNHWKTTLAGDDRRQGIVFTGDPGTRDENSNDFVVDNTFSDIGLDAVSVTTASVFRAVDNVCSLANEQHRILPSLPDYPACIYANSVRKIMLRDDIAVGAPGNGFDLTVEDFTLIHNAAKLNGSNGLLLHASARGVVQHNVFENNNQGSTGMIAGIVLIGGGVDIKLLENLSTDTQAVKTQISGFGSILGSYPRVSLTKTNKLTGNLFSCFAVGSSINTYENSR